jgi:hypothetical protein
MLPLLICALILSWPFAPALALDPREADLVPIGTVLADPQHYNLKSVRFQGTITGITILPLQGGCGNVDAYLFQFADETGDIQVVDQGWCLLGAKGGPPILTLTPAKIGDRISVTAIVMSPTTAPGIQIRAKLQGIGANTCFNLRERIATCRTFEECADKPSHSAR